MKLAEFLSGKSSVDQDAIRQQLEVLSKHSPVTRQFVLNLEIECRLSLTVWQDATGAMTTASAVADDIQAALTSSLQSYVLTGGSIPTPWPVLFGRAVTRQNFYALLKQKAYVTTERAAQLFVSRLLKASVVNTQHRLQRMDLGRYLMWATFDADNLTGNPFDNMPSNAAGIRAHLGLLKEKGDLLLFVYSLPTGVEPVFPTVADAYSSSEWAWFFRPSLAHEVYGRTMCWPHYDNAIPRPEVVHKVITGATLEYPIVTAK